MLTIKDFSDSTRALLDNVMGDDKPAYTNQEVDPTRMNNYIMLTLIDLWNPCNLIDDHARACNNLTDAKNRVKARAIREAGRDWLARNMKDVLPITMKDKEIRKCLMSFANDKMSKYTVRESLLNDVRNYDDRRKKLAAIVENISRITDEELEAIGKMFNVEPQYRTSVEMNYGEWEDNAVKQLEEV